MLIFPIFTVEALMLCNSIYPVYDTLVILTFLYAHRAQITSATTGILQKDKVLQLESIKWNSKLLANNPHLKLLYAQLAMVSTIQFEAKDLLDKTQEESAEILLQKSRDLSAETKPKNARVLSNSALNERNLNTHRHGKIAQFIGIGQAKPVFEPSSVFKGIPMSNITVSQTAELFVETAEKLGITPGPQSFFGPENNTEAFLRTIEKLLPVERPDMHQAILRPEARTQIPKTVFDDAINFGTPGNLLPLESALWVERPVRKKVDLNIGPLNEEQQKNPFLTAAISQREATLKDISSRTRPGSKPKDLTVPPAGSQPRSRTARRGRKKN